MSINPNFLPSSGWTLDNATFDGTALTFSAAGSASITLTEIYGTNIVSDLLVFKAVPSSYVYFTTPKFYCDVEIKPINDPLYKVSIPMLSSKSVIIRLKALSIMSGSIGAFDYIKVKFRASEAMGFTEVSLATSESDSGNYVEIGETYYGVTISTERGLEIKRSDGASEALFNSDAFAMRALVDDVMTDKIYFDPTKGTYVFDGELSADVVKALSAVVTPNLYADKAVIAELTVDSLDTSTKVQNYLNSDTSDVNYIHIENQVLQFRYAHTDGTAYEQVVNRKGQPLYWTDATHTAASADTTTFPVYVYVYEESVKAEFSFTDTSGVYVPQINLGQGTGTGETGKGRIVKDEYGLLLQYNDESGKIATLRLTGYVDGTFRRLKNATINKTAGTVTILMEGRAEADVVSFTETDNSMTFSWPDGFVTSVSIS